jgi:hypothetical protein
MLQVHPVRIRVETPVEHPKHHHRQTET